MTENAVMHLLKQGDNSKAVDTTSLSEWVIFRSGNESIFDWGNMQTGRNHGTTRACIVVGNEF